MVEIYKTNESFIEVNCDYDIALGLSELFSFYTENYKFNPKYKSGIWDGKIRLFNMRTRTMPIGLLSRTIAYLKSIDTEFNLYDGFEKGRNLSPEFIDSVCTALKCKHDLYDYQNEAVRHILYNKKCGILSSTGSGKSFILFILFNILVKLHPKEKYLLVVPTTSLVSQMYDDFIEYGENKRDYSPYLHKVYDSREKQSDKKLFITTWQSIQDMPEEWFKQFHGIFVDEVHTATANELKNIIECSTNAVYKAGLTGSLNESLTSEIQLEGLFGPFKRVSKTSELIKRGVLTDISIESIILGYSPEERLLAKNYSYDEECAFVRKHKKRLGFVTKLTSKLEHNTLVLFKDIDYGKSIVAALEKFASHKKVFYVDGTVKRTVREQIRKECEKMDNAVIVASYGTFSTGINIKNLHNIIFADSLKSKIKIIQSIGRTLRKHATKLIARLYDITDDLTCNIGVNGRKIKSPKKNYLLKHYLTRHKTYIAENFKVKVKEFKL